MRDVWLFLIIFQFEDKINFYTKRYTIHLYLVVLVQLVSWRNRFLRVKYVLLT